jgi:hypothetical protein
MNEQFLPYTKLWRSAGNFNEGYPQWMDGCFFEIDPEKLERDVEARPLPYTFWSK